MKGVARGWGWLLLAFAAGALAQTTAPVTRPDDQLLIVSVTLGPTTIHDGMEAYWDDGRLYVPLLELCEALSIPITGSVDEGSAEGWLRDESWRFVLDSNRRLLSLNGRERDIDWSLLERHETDFYLPIDWLRSWFDLRFEVRLNDSRIHFPLGQGLALEQKLEREQRWSQLARQQPQLLLDVPTWQPDSAWLSWPAIDTSLTLGASGGGTRVVEQVGTETSSRPETSAGFNLLAAGDFLRSSALLSFNLQDSPGLGAATDTRLRLQRPTASADDVGWLAGDTTSPLLPLLSSQVDGVGLRVGHVDDAHAVDFSRTTLRGEALDGWDVELYRNNELLAFATADSSNQYQFDDVPLQPGLNLFRIVLYGPQGQRRERLERLVVGNEMLARGEQRWQAFALLRERRLFPGPLNARPEEPTQDLADSLMAGVGYRRALTSRWGLSLDALSAGLDAGGRHHYLAARTQTSLDAWLLEGQWLKDLTGGWAGRVSAQTLGAVNNAGIDYERFDAFSSIEINSFAAEELLTGRLRARWNNRSIARMPITAEFEQRRSRRPDSDDAHDSYTGRLRLSQRWDAWTAAASWEVGREAGLPDTVDSGVLFSYRHPQFDLTSQWTYRLAPETSIRSAYAAATWAINDRLRLRANLNHSFDLLTSDRVSLGLIWSAARWIASINASYSSDGRYQISANLFTSLQRIDDGWHADSRSGTASASVLAHVFLDRNGNGRFDPGDKPLPKVRFWAGFGGRAPETDDAGQAVLTQLPANQSTLVRLREDSLENPYWVPVHVAQQVNARAGQTVTLPFPVMISSEIDGTVYLEDKNGRNPAANVALQLLDRSGAIVREVRTAFDGFYLFDLLIPGDYTLRVAPEQVSRLSLQSPKPKPASLGADGESFVTIDWTLLPATVAGTH